MMRVHSLFKSFARNRGLLSVLSDISFTAKCGEIVAVVGPSGSGKTTLLRILAGLSTADAGTVEFACATNANSFRTAMVFQEYALFPWLSVEKNISFAFPRKTEKTVDATARVSELLSSVQLENFADAFPHELSSGMQQRVALARALAADPAVLLLDEPFGALDYLTRLQLQVFLSELLVGTKKTTVLVTHDLDEALFLADRVIVLSPRPAKVMASVRVSFSKPRTPNIRTTVAFSKLKARLTKLLLPAQNQVV